MASYGRPVLISGGVKVEKPAVETRAANTYAVAAFVYVERGGQLLQLRRTSAVGRGMWASPGGGKEHGETPEEAAVRELREETGLVPSSPLTLVGLATPHFYGMDDIHCFFACESAAGDVVLNDEHDGFRWVDPVDYRARAYSREREEAARATPDYERWLQFRDVYDQYLAWHNHRAVCVAGLA